MIRKAAGNGKIASAQRLSSECLSGECQSAPCQSAPCQCGGREALAARYQTLWQRVREACDAVPLTVGVTACRRRGGATTVAANLAISAARASWGRVALVEANMPAPVLARAFGLAAGPGLSDVLAERFSLGECLQDTSIENLQVLAAGRTEPRFGPMLGSASSGAMTDILEQLARDFAVVVCDLPAASDASDALRWAAVVDGALLVVASGEQCSPLAYQAKQRLVQSGARLLGAVLNMCPPPEAAPLAPSRLAP